MMIDQTNILIVEDELLIAQSIANKLKKLGYNVCKIVASGQAAIAFIKQKQPDLILMDIALEGAIDGIKTAANIKSHFDIPVIFITAYADDEILERASETGCYGYLIKPFRDRELQAMIKIVLRKHQEQSAIRHALQSTIHQYSTEYDDIYKDNLTNLPTQFFLRDLFEYLSSVALSEDKKYNPTPVYKINRDGIKQPKLEIIVLYNIILDRFDKINNFLSKEQRGLVVKEVAQRLTNCADSFDGNGSAIYFSPDNYVILLAFEDRSMANKCGQKILDSLTASLVIEDHEIYLSPSIGMAFCPYDSTDVEELLRQSAKAVEYAKTQGGNRCQSFTFAFNVRQNRASNELRLEAELHHALERGELELYYQPKVELLNNSIFGAEALLRWHHPRLGRITADKFIHIAEESGLIKTIGEWILSSTCRQMQSWHHSGLDNIKVSVNLSGSQFKQSDLFHKITQILFHNSLSAQYLGLEVTETTLVENVKVNVQKLNSLKRLGIQIALDDFGTGYASLGYLQQFPFDVVKMDSCFIRDINNNKVSAVIVENIIAMAHQLGLKVVAEGIETEAELNFLRNAQCDMGQGFLFSRPLPAKEFYKLVINQKVPKIENVI